MTHGEGTNRTDSLNAALFLLFSISIRWKVDGEVMNRMKSMGMNVESAEKTTDNPK